MHTIQLNIDDSIFDKFMGLIEILPRDKVEITSQMDYPSISFEEAKEKVHRAVNSISANKGIPLNQAIEKVTTLTTKIVEI
ncbi:hypothetical protein [Sulfurimonas sp.]|uniref:hypothetical protein n=1 Tax=Sulfurimonas sp. TaxID=2022749 RepID=UPI00286E74D6|nr:hypothetical protein [Sulfurimonas sp.]